jgi:hypothetical protein
LLLLPGVPPPSDLNPGDVLLPFLNPAGVRGLLAVNPDDEGRAIAGLTSAAAAAAAAAATSD